MKAHGNCVSYSPAFQNAVAKLVDALDNGHAQLQRYFGHFRYAPKEAGWTSER